MDFAYAGVGDILQDVLLRELFQVAGQVLGVDKRSGVFRAGAEEVVAFRFNAEGAVFGRGGVFDEPARVRMHGIQGDIVLGECHDPGKGIPLPER